MGYTITIGEASLGDGDSQWRCIVDRLAFPEAPAAENDAHPHVNSRWPSYLVWADFARDVGLYDLFYDEEEGLLRPHPGCAILTRKHADRISESLRIFRSEHPDARAGFDAPSGNPVADLCSPPQRPPCDYTLARLEWLDWWVRWAVDNCEHPAMRNS